MPKPTGQASLFDSSSEDSTQLPVPGIPGNRQALTPAQRKFNKLIAEIEALRLKLQDWRGFETTYHQAVTGTLQPVAERWRSARIQLVQLFDRAAANPKLGKTQRAKARDILLAHAEVLLDEAPDPTLLEIFERHSGVAFDTLQADEVERLRELAREAFGVELDKLRPGMSELEFAQAVEEQLDADRDAAGGPAHAAKAAKKARPRHGKKALAQERREQALRQAKQSLREVYRRLAMALHPDREPDPALRERKSELMREANLAYQAKDLLGLLELQLQTAQIDAAVMASLDPVRLDSYILVLEEQLQSLQRELSELIDPYFALVRGTRRDTMTPDHVLRALEAETREMRTLTRDLEKELLTLRDPDVLKTWLKGYRRG